MLGTAGPALEDVLVLRVLATSLGIRQASGQVTFLLPRNATIPTKREVRDQPLRAAGPIICQCDTVVAHVARCLSQLASLFFDRPPLYISPMVLRSTAPNQQKIARKQSRGVRDCLPEPA